MPNWKKVIVSGSDASLNNIDANVISGSTIEASTLVTSSAVTTALLTSDKFFVAPTGSGSVPAKSYQIPFFDTSSGTNNDTLYKDNQSKLAWNPSGVLGVGGNIIASGFITASSINASTEITVGGETNTANLRINSIPTGSDQTRIVVVDNTGSTFFRTDLDLQGAQGATGPIGNTGAIGPVGPVGPLGPQGNQGNQGIQGTIGQKGTFGEKGDDGAQGTEAETPITQNFTITVSNPGAGNRYYINGVLQDTLTLLKGFTYTFNQTDS